jgi:hypothetical protein
MKASRRLGLTRCSRGSRNWPDMYKGTNGRMLADTAIELMVVDLRTSVAPSECKAWPSPSSANGQRAGKVAASRKLSIAVSTDPTVISLSSLSLVGFQGKR